MPTLQRGILQAESPNAIIIAVVTAAGRTKALGAQRQGRDWRWCRGGGKARGEAEARRRQRQGGGKARRRRDEGNGGSN
jgi:hypothetical protein